MKESLDPSRTADLGDASEEPNESTQFSWVSLLAAGVRHGRLILLCGVALALLQSLRGLVGERTYTTTAVFMTERASGQITQALQLAARFGLGAGVSSSTPSVYLIERALRSRPLRDSVASRSYRTMVDGELEPALLPELLEIESRNEFQKMRRTRQWLGRAMQVQRDLASGIFTVRVRTRWPHVSRDVATYVIDELNDLTVELRQATPEADVGFLEGRLRQTKAARDSAEQAWLAFRSANRDFGPWSPLTLEGQRLQAQFDRLDGRYEYLLTVYADAMTEALRDTPVIAVIQPPYLPMRPDSRQIAFSGTSGLVGGCLLAFLAVIVAQYAKRPPSAAFGELREAWDNFAAPIPILRRLFRT